MSPVATLAPARRTSPSRATGQIRSWEEELEAASRERVRRVRSQIAAGGYITDEKIDTAIERLMADL